MTNSEIKDTIEKEFGWLSPDEKQKLNALIISVWNHGVVASAQLVDNNKNILEAVKPHKGDRIFKFGISVCHDLINTINALKLKFGDV